MQHLLIKKIDWDHELDFDLTKQWLCRYQDLSVRNGLKLDRWLNYSSDDNLCENHGFADASKLAYGVEIRFC